jgi:hypothetical protein
MPRATSHNLRCFLVLGLIVSPLVVFGAGAQAAPPGDSPEQKAGAPTYGNTDLERYAGERSSPPAAEADAPAETAASGVESTAEDRGEAYWRRRADDARDAIGRAEAELARAEAVRDAQGAEPERNPMRQPKQTDALEQDPYRVLTAADGAQSLDAAVEQARSDLERALAAEAELQSEARRARALPGWLREH